MGVGVGVLVDVGNDDVIKDLTTLYHCYKIQKSRDACELTTK